MSQQASVIVRIREMILRGEMQPGERVPEAAIALRLGLSRTPVRQALPVLADEGLLVNAGARGFAVRSFTQTEIIEAIELRAVLEGVAARTIAERGASRALLRELRETLADGDEIFAKRHLVEADEDSYSSVNAAFHRQIAEGAGQNFILDTLERINRLPFAAPATIAFDQFNLARMYDLLWYAHRQHHAIVEAIAAGEGARAENLFREHVYAQRHSMNLWRTNPAKPDDDAGRRSSRKTPQTGRFGEESRK